MTVTGARRRATSDRSAIAWTTSMAQASESGWCGHHEMPASVARVSSAAKPTATSTSATSPRGRNRLSTSMPLTLGHRGQAARSPRP